MGLSSTTNRVSFVGDGSSVVFPFPYYFFSQKDLSVYLFDTGSSIVYPQNFGSNYSISGSVTAQGVYPNGGNVVMTSSFPSNLQLIITRNPSQVQNYVLNQNGTINSLALVQQFDYLTALVQRIQDEVSRCIQLPDGLGILNSTPFNQVLPSSVALPSNGGAPLVLNSGATAWTFGFVNGNTGFNGVLPYFNGGTGQSAQFTQYGVWYSATTSTLGQIAPSTPGLVLTAQGSSAPIWGPVVITGSSVSSLVAGVGITITGSSFPTISASSIVLPSVVAGTGVNVSGTTVFTVNASSIVLPTILAGTGISVIGSTAYTVFASSVIPINLASQVSGTLPAGNGGTGVSSFSPQYGVLYASSATSVAIVPSATTGFVLTAQGSSAPLFQQIGQSALTIINATSAITIANNVGIILVGSGCPTINLYGAPGNGGIPLRIVKTNSGFDNTTITCSNGTIGGLASVNLSTQRESYELYSDNTNFQIHDHFTKTAVTITTNTFTCSSANPVKGTIGVDQFSSWRDGKFLKFKIEYAQTAAGSAGTGDLFLNPLAGTLSSLLIDSSLIKFNTTPAAISIGYSSVSHIGFVMSNSGGATSSDEGYMTPYDTQRLRVVSMASKVTVQGNTTSWAFNGATLLIMAHGEIPIAGWQP